MIRTLLLVLLFAFGLVEARDPYVHWWRQPWTRNFGDELGPALVERITGRPARYGGRWHSRKLLTIGSILHFAGDDDLVWGSGINGKELDTSGYHFSRLQVCAVRGPLTREFLLKQRVVCPEIYGDPALLVPRYFPEFKVEPKEEYIVIPHYSELDHFSDQPHLVLPTAPWQEVVARIVQARFVISSSLHGLVVAEAFGIPARHLRVTDNEPDFKYEDYYRGTGRASFQSATSVEEALRLGGEPPPVADLDALAGAFPSAAFAR